MFLIIQVLRANLALKFLQMMQVEVGQIRAVIAKVVQIVRVAVRAIAVQVVVPAQVVQVAVAISFFVKMWYK